MNLETLKLGLLGIFCITAAIAGVADWAILHILALVSGVIVGALLLWETLQ